MSMIVNPFVFGAGGGGWSGPPGFIAHGGIADRASVGGPLDVPYPAGLQADDIAFLQVISLSALATAHTISTPAGWTQASQQPLPSSTGYYQALFWKRLSGGESGTVNVTTSIGDPAASHTLAGVMSIWRGAVASGTPYEALDNNAARNVDMTGSSVTTTGADRTILNFCGCDDNTLSAEAALWTEEYELLTPAGVDAGLKVYSLEQPTADTVAAVTHTLAASERWQVISLALIPA